MYHLFLDSAYTVISYDICVSLSDLPQKLLHSKGNHKQNEKTTHRMGENICKWCDWQWISLQNLQTAHAAQYQNKQTTQSRNGQKT